MIISIGILIIGLPRLGLIATGLSYIASVGISRSVEMAIGLKYYNTGNSNTKVAIMMILSAVVACLALFSKGAFFDIIAAIGLLMLCFYIGYKDLVLSTRFLLNNIRKEET